MPLVSVYDPAPVTIAGKANRMPRKGWSCSVVFVSDLSDRLVAQVFSPSKSDAVELAERVGWGVWRAGMHYEGQALLPWDGAPYAPPSVHPYASEPGHWARAVVEPMAWIFVHGRLEETGPQWGRASYFAACADLGLVSGPARWDHRAQYCSIRRAPTADGWTVDDAVSEMGEPHVVKRRRGVHPVAVLHALAAEATSPAQG